MQTSPLRPSPEQAPITHVSRSPETTEGIARDLATGLSRRETLCLDGTLGAGKSVFARALIRALIGDEDLAVPSPSYTLANVYAGPDGREIWHADLYRISDPEEIIEIGLQDAAGEALLIVEWAQNWPTRPADAMTIAFEVIGDTERRITLSGSHPTAPGTT